VQSCIVFWALARFTFGATQMLGTIRRRVWRFLRRHGLEPGEDGTGSEDPVAEASPALAGIVGASVQGRVALGAPQGRRSADLAVGSRARRRRITPRARTPGR
jgi:hypothetical protein